MIRAYRDGRTGKLFIDVCRETNGRITHIEKINGDGTATMVPIEDGNEFPEPTFTIAYYDVPELISQLNDLKIKSDNHFKIEGELDATKYHLEDMRSLLKLKK